MRTFERQLTIYDKVEIIELTKCIAFNFDVKSQLKNTSFFISKKDLPENWEQKVFSLFDHDKKYSYFDDEFWKSMLRLGVPEALDIYHSSIINTIEAINMSDFDENKVIYVDGRTHQIYNMDLEYPISLPYRITGVMGIHRDYFNVGKTKEILSNNPYILWMEEHTIGLDISIRLPQDVHDKIADMCKRNGGQNWSSRIKENIIYRPYNKLDILGLKSCYIDQ